MGIIIDQYNRDIRNNTGYMYTTNAKKSAVVANKRLTDATLAMYDINNKKVIDIGCGDGAYTYELFIRGRPEYILGIDAAEEAVKLARKKYSCKKLKFDFADCEDWNSMSALGKFDIAILRGVLHHLDHPQKAIKNVSKVADKILIIEPNGYNLALKLLERVSKYHIEHREKSHTKRRLGRWFSKVNFIVERDCFIGFVPFFCPDLLVVSLKKIERVLEKIPVLRNFCCAAYVAVFKPVEE